MLDNLSKLRLQKAFLKAAEYAKLKIGGVAVDEDLRKRFHALMLQAYYKKRINLRQKLKS